MLIIPYVCLTLSTLIIRFIDILQKNMVLSKTVKNILKIFPEAVLIQGLDEKSNELTIKFINQAAKSSLISYLSPYGKPIDDAKLKFSLKDEIYGNFCNQRQGQGTQSCELTLSEVLSFHQSLLSDAQEEVVSSIELTPLLQDKEDEHPRHFNLKTIKVNWESSGASFMHVFINTTHIKKYEHEKTTNELLQLMFSSISHEFRSPLNAFSNALSMLEINYNSNFDRLQALADNESRDSKTLMRQMDSSKKYFKIGKVSSTLMLNLTEDILDLAKMQAKSFSLNNEAFSVRTLAEEIEYLFSFQYEGKSLFFILDVDEQTLRTSFCSDMGRIKQILLNLLSNALKFTSMGGVTLTIRLSRAFDEDLFQH